jgi:uncharacterized protein
MLVALERPQIAAWAKGWRRAALRTARHLGGLALGVIVLWLGLCFLAAWLFTRRVEPLTPEPAPIVDWGTFETTRVRTSDGQDLGGWFVDGSLLAPSILILHGHGGNRGWCLPQAEIFARAGCSVFLISMRASGDSTGDSTDVGWSNRKDVVAAVDWLEKKRPGRPIHVMGMSMGAAAAIFAAKDLGTRVSGYIFESPYRDLRTAVKNRADIYLPDPLNKALYAGIMLSAPAFLEDVDLIAPVDAISGIPSSTPVTIIYGEDDNRARPEEAIALHDRIAAHCELVPIPGGRHWACRTAAPELYRRTLLESVGRL